MTERFLPKPTNGQLATSPCGGSNCLVWSSARAVEYATRGAVAANTGLIRQRISGTTCGGTTLAQVAAAINAMYGVSLLVRYSMPFDDFAFLVEAGRAAVTYIGYAPMHGSSEDAFPTFNGGHGILVVDVRGTKPNREFLDLDPGADGRRTGIPNMINTTGRWWPEELLKRATGAMPAGSGTVGYGLVSAGFTVDTEDEADMGNIDAKKIAPPALVDIAPTALYADEACTTLAYPGADKWPGALAVGSYGWLQVPATKAFPVRIDLLTGGAGWMLAWAPKGACSNFRSDPIWCPPSAPVIGHTDEEMEAAVKKATDELNLRIDNAQKPI